MCNSQLCGIFRFKDLSDLLHCLTITVYIDKHTLPHPFFGLAFHLPVLMTFLPLILSLIFATVQARKLAYLCFFVTLTSAGFFGFLQVSGVIWLFIFMFTCLLWQKLESNHWHLFCALSIFVLSLIFLLHKATGYNNVLMFDNIVLKQNSVPFTQYLNLDKGILGFILLMFIVPKPKTLSVKIMPSIMLVFAVLTIACLNLALLMQLVEFDFKLLPMAFAWSCTNLFLTCLVEEAFFRGFIQQQCQSLSKKMMWQYLCILLSGLLFGLAHFPAGMTYTSIAVVMGSVYAYAYWKSNNIMLPIALHFAFNCIHFFCFSYPYLQP